MGATEVAVEETPPYYARGMTILLLMLLIFRYPRHPWRVRESNSFTAASIWHRLGRGDADSGEHCTYLLACNVPTGAYHATSIGSAVVGVVALWFDIEGRVLHLLGCYYHEFSFQIKECEAVEARDDITM